MISPKNPESYHISERGICWLLFVCYCEGGATHPIYLYTSKIFCQVGLWRRRVLCFHIRVFQWSHSSQYSIIPMWVRQHRSSFHLCCLHVKCLLSCRHTEQYVPREFLRSTAPDISQQSLLFRNSELPLCVCFRISNCYCTELSSYHSALHCEYSKANNTQNKGPESKKHIPHKEHANTFQGNIYTAGLWCVAGHQKLLHCALCACVVFSSSSPLENGETWPHLFLRREATFIIYFRYSAKGHFWEDVKQA